MEGVVASLSFGQDKDRAKPKPQDFTDQGLAGRSFAGQKLAGARFDRADLVGANFDDADLTGASFTDADLTRATFRRALLERAGFEDLHLPGADLAGAKTGDAQAKLEARLELAKALAETLRSLFIATSGLLGYVAASIVSASDALVLTNQTTMDLPLVQAKVSVHAFFYFSAVISVALGSYTLSRVSHFARVVARLPGRLPDGPPFQEQVDPWVLSCVGVFERTDLPLHRSAELSVFVRGLFEWAGVRLPGVVVRWMPPAVLWLLLLRYFSACRWDFAAVSIDCGFVFLVLMFFASIAIAFGLRSYSELVVGVKPLANLSEYAALAGVMVLSAIGLPMAIALIVGKGGPGQPLAGVRLARAHLNYWNLSASNLEQANLSETDLSGARLEEAQLHDADLRLAKLDDSSFISADLTGAKLSFADGARVNFGSATLNKSDLRQANLPDAIFQHAQLNGALLNHLKATGALAANASFSGAILDDAVFDSALLNGALFSGGTTLFRSHFRNSDLSSVSFNSAQLFGADLEGSNLTSASFSGARISTVNMDGALLRQTAMNIVEAWKLSLKKATIEWVTFCSEPAGEKLNLAGSQFTGARLSHVKFVNVTLDGANFDRAVLENVDFGGSVVTNASFLDAELTRVKLKAANRTGSALSTTQLGGSDDNQAATVFAGPR